MPYNDYEPCNCKDNSTYSALRQSHLIPFGENGRIAAGKKLDILQFEFVAGMNKISFEVVQLLDLLW